MGSLSCRDHVYSGQIGSDANIFVKSFNSIKSLNLLMQSGKAGPNKVVILFTCMEKSFNLLITSERDCCCTTFTFQIDT